MRKTRLKMALYLAKRINMPPVFKIDRSYVEFSVLLNGEQQQFRFFALNDLQNQRLAALSLGVQKSPESVAQFMQEQAQIIEENLVSLHPECAQELQGQFIEALALNGKSAEFLSFIQEELEALRAQKKPSLKHS